ncbi:hypothetical protein ACIRJO_37730 [Streptomyces sp. NPDC102394]|uniref:hypothetical protein n=1 Tax=Streptomyces sp. NPDC102394 TaxID=3366167 RepID=UPI00381EDB78
MTPPLRWWRWRRGVAKRPAPASTSLPGEVTSSVARGDVDVQGDANRVAGPAAHHNNLGDINVSGSTGVIAVAGPNLGSIAVTVNPPQPGTEPGTWLKPGEYLGQMNRGSIYTHRWRLAGRAQVMDHLLSFANDEEGRVGLLVGRGGVGKTKVLTALCEAVEGAEPPVEVRVLSQSPYINHAAFEQLPRDGKLLVVIDDAHDQALPLGEIIAGIQEANSAANVLLALRPYGVAHTRRELIHVNMHPSETVLAEIGDLEFDDAVSLAREVLDDAGQVYAPRLAAAARDCPLLIVTGAALINRGELDPRGFEGDEQLHVELTDRLADALAIDSGSEPQRQSLLCALAAFQPVRLNEPAVIDSLKALTGLQADALSSHLTALEQAGVLLRHNASVRVVPDLLGDALLVRAARHHSGMPSGYLDKALEAARGSALSNLVVNVGRVDWQDRGVSADELIEPVWASITQSFQAADARERVSILEVVAKVAFFQPRRALELASWVLVNPSDPVTADGGFSLNLTYGDADVRRALAPVLQPVAHHSEFLPEAAGLLWALGSNDSRPTHQHPHHPLRVLAELAGFTRYGPTVYQQILVTQVERWLARQPATCTLHQPLSVLAPLLATEGHDEVWRRPDTLTFLSYLVPPAPEVLDLRDKALKLAFAELGNARLEATAAAVRLIGAAVTLPHGGYGLTVTPEMRQAWVPHISNVIDRLHRYLVDHPLAPAILIAVRTELRWLGQYGPDDIRGSAREVLAAIPKTVDNELARALHGGPTDPTDSPETPDRSQAQKDLFASVVDTLTDWPDNKVVSRMSTLLADERRVFDKDKGFLARPFIWELVSQRPSVGEALCEHALSAPADPLASLVSVALSAMGRCAGNRAVQWGRALLTDGNVELAREVAHAFGYQRDRNDLLNGEADLLRDLAAHEDSIVHAATLGAVLRIGIQYRDLTIELLTTPRHDEAGITELAMALGGPPSGSLSWSDLTERQQTNILARLTACHSLDTYELQQFLAELARTEPLEVVQLLQARVETYESSPTLGYDPLPFAWQVAPPFRSHDDFPGLLRKIGDWLAAAPESPRRSFLGAELFALVAGTYDGRVTSLIDEYLGDSTRLKIVTTILRKAPRDLVWNREFVRRCLRAADRHGDALLGAMQNALYAAVISGMRSAAPGKPYPQDVEQFEKASALADSCDQGSVEEQFYRALAASAENSMQRERHDLPPDNRDW